MPSLLDLSPEFQPRTKELLTNCEAKGVIMKPYFTVRDPFIQAKMWRQSRSRLEIEAKIAEIKDEAPFLAHCLISIGPQHGPQVTHALPGLSWHQWGEAMDCFWEVDGKAEWSIERKISGINGYEVYATEADLLNLEPGGFWRMKDYAHVQLRHEASPLKLYSLSEIDRRMEQRYGG